MSDRLILMGFASDGLTSDGLISTGLTSLVGGGGVIGVKLRELESEVFLSGAGKDEEKRKDGAAGLGGGWKRGGVGLEASAKRGGAS